MGKLQQLIERIKRTPLNVGSLKKIMPKYCTFKLLSQLTEHRSQLFKTHKCIIVLIPSDFSNVGHYVLLTAFRKYIEYFSSIGGSPVKETQKLGQNGSLLMKLLGKNYVYNSKPLQAQSTTIEDCALHVLCRAKLKDLKLADYQRLFSTRVNLTTPDSIVAMLTILMVVDL